MKFDLSKKLVRYSKCTDVRREFIAFDIYDWDDVKKLSKKVLSFQGRDFVYSGWNSDKMEIYFYRPLDGGLNIATIK